MATSDCFVSVVSPLYNDADLVQAFMEEVLSVLKHEYENYELVLIDDGSTDETVELVATLLKQYDCVRLVRLSRRFGQETAISAGLDAAIGDFVVVMLPDSDPPDLIPGMVERCREGVGVVFGVRKDRRGEPMYLRVGSRLFYWYLRNVLGANVPPNARDFRVFSRQVVNAITGIKDQLRYLRVFSTYVGYGTASFEYEPIQRRQKPRVKTFGQAVRTAFDTILANSTQPLRAVSLLGLGLAIASALHMVYVVLVYAFQENTMEGWVTRSLHSSLMFMFIFLILAALCEYVGRMSQDVKGRPSYFILEERSSSVLLVDESRKNVVTKSLNE